MYCLLVEIVTKGTSGEANRCEGPRRLVEAERCARRVDRRWARRIGAAVATTVLAMAGAAGMFPSGIAQAAPAIPSCPDPVQTGVATFVVTCSFTGDAQVWIPDPRVTSATFDVRGAQGGYFSGHAVAGGLGGETVSTLDVTPPFPIEIVVGGQGGAFPNPTAGFNGGGSAYHDFGLGGGGASDVRIGACAGTASCDLSARAVVAGGGGGTDASPTVNGGNGGGLTGASGGTTNTSDSGGGGGAGTQTGGGAAGTSPPSPKAAATDGSLGQGGTGGIVDGGTSGGGGGGGYYGGGGGGGGAGNGRTTPSGGGGGGGSGYGPAGSTFSTGVQSGNGVVIITYVIPLSQTITFTSTPPTGAVVGGPTYALAATGGGSGNPVVFSSGSPAVCTVSGATVGFVGVGTCAIHADQAGNANYRAAPRVTQSFAVGKGAQAITFTSTPPTAAAVVGGPTYALAATGGGSGNPVVFSSGSPAVCTVSGATVGFVGVGTCVIDADQAGDANYDPAPQATQSFAVGKGAQTITFTSTPPTGAVVGPTYALAATGGGSGNPVLFSSGSPAVCTVSGATVGFVGVGTCVIDADQAGDANYDPAPQATQSFAVGKGAQAITFTSTPPTGAVVGGPTNALAATGGASGNPVLFSTGSPAVCTVSGATVSFVGAGTCVIDADQAGDANYDPAPQATQSFAVGKGAQAITFTSTPPAAAVVGGPTYTVSATGGASGNPVLFSTGSPAVCTVSGATVSFVGVGTCVIDADQAGDANYDPAPQATQSFAVGKGAQTITFTSTPPTGAVVGGPIYALAATGGASANPVLFSTGSPAVCTVSGTTVSFVGAGTCVIDADQAGDANYDPAPQATQSFAVGKGAQTITFTSTPPTAAAVVGGPTYALAATGGGSANPVLFSTGSPAVCTVSGTTVSFVGVGTCVIDADQAGDANYDPAPQATQSFAVGKGAQTITFTSTPPTAAAVSGPTYALAATGGASGNPVLFSTGSPAVCTVSGTTVSFVGAGTCVIDADQAGQHQLSPGPAGHPVDDCLGGRSRRTDRSGGHTASRGNRADLASPHRHRRRTNQRLPRSARHRCRARESSSVGHRARHVVHRGNRPVHRSRDHFHRFHRHVRSHVLLRRGSSQQRRGVGGIERGVRSNAGDLGANPPGDKHPHRSTASGSCSHRSKCRHAMANGGRADGHRRRRTASRHRRHPPPEPHSRSPPPLTAPPPPQTSRHHVTSSRCISTAPGPRNPLTPH